MLGRTFRKRSRKLCTFSDVNEQKLFVLTKWMSSKGFKSSKQMKLKIFKETGRGLMTKEAIRPGDVIISIPKKLLMTPKSVLNSYLGVYFKRYFPEATGHQILSVFLMCEQAKGEASDWYPYICFLPKKYSIPLCLSHHSLNLLPKSIYMSAKIQHDSVKNSFSQLGTLISALQNDFAAFQDINYEQFKWAWSSVNTRCVFMKCLGDCPGEQCTYHLALAPFLDLLNHSVDVQVSAGFNKEKDHYEIISHSHFKKHSQVFINYGCHDNQKLFLEYGFVADGNYNDFVAFSIDDILLAYEICNLPSKGLDAKLKFVKDNNLLRNIVCTRDGISWNLLIILRIFTSEYNIKLWNTLIHDAYSQGMENSEFRSLKRALINLKIKEYTKKESYSDCTECSYNQTIIFKLCTILGSILKKAMS